MTLGQGVEVGPFHFTIIRIIIATGLARVLIGGERLAGGMNSLDWLMLVWAACAMASSFFHKDSSEALVFRLGLVYNACGIYFLLRIYCQSLDDVEKLCIFTAILLIPVAMEMLYEHVAFHNLFSVLGGVPEIPQIREGRIRAFGPFTHPILAGTVGAVCLPLMVGIWQRHRNIAFSGIAACLTMVVASGSSGPIMSVIAAIASLFMWHHREKMRLIRWLVVITYIFLEAIMKVPAYYIIWRLNVAGGSTGYYRAALIDSALKHLNEWWMAGTDYTRHWMPSGVSWSPDHVDITNEYLIMGVIGGLPLMFLFIAILTKGFSFVGQTQKQPSDLPAESQFMTWALGAALFAHTVTFVSVSYFDQSFLFIYLTFAAIGSAYSSTVAAQSVDRSAAA
jgi:phage shock protein PspC (stress-responsive transcriptional regulator)